MKPHLRDGQYEQGLTLGVQLLTAYLNGDRPGFDETMEAVTTLLGILGIFGACIGCMACIDVCHRQRDRRLRQELRNDLVRLDRDRTLAYQGKYYPATSCPICLEDFFRYGNTSTPYPNDNSSSKKNDGERSPLMMRDKDDNGEPLQLLSCGHVFHQSCWKDFSENPKSTENKNDGALQCPICRQVVKPTSTAASMTKTPLDDVAYQPERRFRLERLQEMYPTFIGTQYVDQWYDPDYRGSLLEDYNNIEREQQLAAERAEAERNRMFSYDSNNDDASSPPDFGGGQADGGGVGGSF